MKNIMQNIFKYFSKKFRKRRVQLLKNKFNFNSLGLIADLGGYDGSHFQRVVDKNFFLIEPSLKGLKLANQKQIIPIMIDDDCNIPLKDKALDFLFCNSVIEHATGPRKIQLVEKDGKKFRKTARFYQKRLADEIQRVAKTYWVQTPNRHFPLEPHVLIPFYQYLPRRIYVNSLKYLNDYWITSTSGDCSLLSQSELALLFPSSNIITTSFCGFKKSLIAYKKREISF